MRGVERRDGQVKQVALVKLACSRYDDPITRVSASQLRSSSDYGIVDTDVPLRETYLEDQIQRLVEGEPMRPPTQNDLTTINRIY